MNIQIVHIQFLWKTQCISGYFTEMFY